ncbi:MAG: hypothetical protein ACYTFA_14035 [Planctomycetota bacterium]
MKPDRLHIPVITFFGVLALAGGSAARADVGPPIGIRLPLDTPQAVAGQEYNGKFLVHVFKPVTLDRLQLAGAGWNAVTFISSHESVRVARSSDYVTRSGGQIRFSWSALPLDLVRL